jgi:hypothetical protein
MAKTVIDSNPFAVDDPFKAPESQQKYAPDDYYADSANPYEAMARPPNAISPKTVKEAAMSNPSYSNDSSAYSDNARAAGSKQPQQRDQKAEELAQREEALLRREAALIVREKSGGTGPVENNWPSKCYPITHHDIAGDIPQRHRALIRKFYANLMLAWLALLLNWMLVMFVVFSPATGPFPDKPGSAAALWSSVYLLLGVPGSWNLWYRSVYNGAKNGTSSKWMFFFVNYAAHTIFCLVMALGPSPSSVAGGGLFFIVEMITESNHEATIFAVITMILWAMNGALGVFLLRHAHNHWKTDGHQDALKRDMATAIVTAGVDSTTSGRV